MENCSKKRPRIDLDRIYAVGEWVAELKGQQCVTSTTIDDKGEEDITVDGHKYEIKTVKTPAWQWLPDYNSGNSANLSTEVAFLNDEAKPRGTCKMAKFRDGRLDGIYFVIPSLSKIVFFSRDELLEETQRNGSYWVKQRHTKEFSSDGIYHWEKKVLVNLMHGHSYPFNKPYK